MYGYVAQGFIPAKAGCGSACSALPELDYWVLDIDYWIFNCGLSGLE